MTFLIMIFMFATLVGLLWISIRITGALLSACLWLFVCVPIALFICILGLALCCTIILMPAGMMLIRTGIGMIFWGC